MHIHLESRSGASGKFWQLKVSGATHEIRFGKIGTAGQTRTRTFATAREAREAAEQLVAEKRQKGYGDAGGTSKKPRKANDRVSRQLQQLDWPTRAFAFTSTPSVTQDSRNAFERLLLLSQDQIHQLELRACLANARERQPDEGGNIWHEHIRPRDGSAWVFRVDHETGEIFGDIYPDEVFGVLYPSEMLEEEYADSSGRPDPRKVRALYRSKVPRLSRSDETRAAETIHYLWERSDWLVSVLYGEQPSEDLSLPDDDLQHELTVPAFRDAPGLALYWLWRAFFLEEGPALARVLPEAKQSHLVVIRDAARLVEQLQRGKLRALGPVKDVLAVRAAFLAARKPGASKPRKPSRRG